MHQVEIAEKPYQQYLAASIQTELGRLLPAACPVYTQGSKEFQESVYRFTQYDRPTYIAAVRPTTEQDVAITVKYAHMRGIPCAAKGGGHCVSNSMNTLRDGIVIDLKNLNKLSFDSAKDEVTAAGGIQSGQFIEFVHQQKREVTVGSCPTTGLLGVCLGGGIGRLQGKYGYLSDNLVSCRIVLADGAVLQLSETENKDLFWAVRGAGHNFGIVVEATFKVYTQEHHGLHHSWDFEFRLDQARGVFELMNDLLVEDLDPNLSIFVLWSAKASSGAKAVVLVNVVWSGAKDGAQEYIRQLDALSPIVPATQVTAEWPTLPWVTYQGLNAKSLGNPASWSVRPYKIFSAASSKKFHLETMSELFQSVQALEEQGHFIITVMIEIFSHKKVRELPDNATAYPWRNGSDIFLMLATQAETLKHESLACDWINMWKGEFIEHSGYGRLQQYANYGHGTQVPDPVEALYGYDEWRLQKLRRLKEVYDPENWFRWYQPLIEPSRSRIA